MKENFIQTGTMGLRGPTGEITHNIPLYIKASDAGEINTATGRTVAEDAALGDVAKIFAEKMKQYDLGNKKINRKAKRASTEERK